MDDRQASHPLLAPGTGGAEGRTGGHIIRLALAHRAPSSFSAVILDVPRGRFGPAAPRRVAVALPRIVLSDTRWIVAFDVATQGGTTVLFRRTKIILGHRRARHEI